MCGPAAVPIAMMVMSAATTAYSIHEQNTQANYMAAVEKQNAERNNQALMDNYRLQTHQLNLQQLQESEATALEKHRQRLAVQKEVASQRVAAGEAGLSGLSIDSIFADIIREGANNMTTLDRNLEDSNYQRATEMKALHHNTSSGLQNPSFYKGSNRMLGAGLQIGSSAASGYVAGGGKLGSKTV